MPCIYMQGLRDDRTFVYPKQKEKGKRVVTVISFKPKGYLLKEM